MIRSFLATPFMVLMGISGFISVISLKIACAIQGIDMSEFLEEKMKDIQH